MSEYTHRTIIVPAAFQQLAQGLCEAAAEGDAGKGMFTTGLSADGTEPATHYISTGFVDSAFAALMPCTTYPTEEGAEPVTEPGNAAMIAAAAAAQGLSVTAAQVQAVFDGADVSEQDAHQAMTRMGLQVIEQETL